MKCVILEDELPAAAGLAQLLTDSRHHVDLQAVIHNLHDGIRWLKQNPCPDLILMDINLTDGLSFELFDQVKITCPVIFTTAHNDYWMQAFEHNGIDYLLKPISAEKLDAALSKLDQLKQHFTTQQLKWDRAAGGKDAQYKKRFLVKKGSELLSIPTDQIAYFYSANKMVCLVSREGNKFVMDPSLTEIEKNLDPDQFFRLNRQVLASRQSISKVKTYVKSKLIVELVPAFQEEVVISQETLSLFKDWMDN